VRPALATTAACVALLAACGRTPQFPVVTNGHAGATAAGSQAGAGGAGTAGAGAADTGAAGAAGASQPDAQTGPRAHAVSVAVGDAHACALLDTHDVRCWGQGGAPANRQPTPGAVAIAAGGSGTCEIMDDGRVMCWSAEADSAFASPPEFYLPYPGNYFPDKHTAKSLAMNRGPWSCAVLDDNSVFCWDDGWKFLKASQMMPVAVPTGSPPIRQLILNDPNETMALYDDGTVSPSLSFAISPGSLVDGRAFTAVAGSAATWGWCGAVVGGGVFCESVFGPTTSDVFTSIAVGEAYGCGTRADGTVSCWGQITGCDDTNPALTYWCKTPRNADGTHDVLLGQPAVSVAIGTSYTNDICAALADGTVKCWGGPDLTSNKCCADDPILGKSLPITRTATGHAYGAWGAIDLGPAP
jgi:hypothetical protein